MGVLAWLGLQRGDAYPNLDSLLRELKRAMPQDENVVLRYISVVVLLLAKVAWADGRFTEKEESALRLLLSHIDRIGATGIDAVCEALREHARPLTDEEVAVCYNELKALCDGRERLEVMRLLAGIASSDGALLPEERAELETIAAAIGVSSDELATLEAEARAQRSAPP